MFFSKAKSAVKAAAKRIFKRADNSNRSADNNGSITVDTIKAVAKRIFARNIDSSCASNNSSNNGSDDSSFAVSASISANNTDSTNNHSSTVNTDNTNITNISNNNNCIAIINSARNMDNSNCGNNSCNCNCDCSCNGGCNGNCACNDYDSDSDCDCSDCESICSGDYNPYSDGNGFFSADSDFFSDIVCSGGFGFYSGGYSEIVCSADYILFSGGNEIDGEIFSEIYSDSEYTDSICSGENDICGNSVSNPTTTTTTISAASSFKALAKHTFKSKGNSDSTTSDASKTIKSFIERAHERSRTFFQRTRGRGYN
ncbi:hypothetical protein GGH96_001583 [Coemansia sp. RSA 1972]|nr:hypothetical protein GGH96_001583 [Coemansia sp. RSA 1972]